MNQDTSWKARCRYCGKTSTVEIDSDPRRLLAVIASLYCPNCMQPGPWDLLEPVQSASMSADIPPVKTPSADPAGGLAPARTGAAQLVRRLTGRTKPGPRS
jgi:hypothetical protein